MNNCKEIKDCGYSQVEFCGCDYKVDLKCTNYNGDRLTPLNVNPGATGHDIVVLINRFLKDLAENIQTDTTDIQSVGNGLRIYKGLSSDYKNQIKTLLKGDGITLTETENEILISVDTAWIDSKLEFQNIGQGQDVYQNIQGKHSFSRILSDDSSITVTKKSDGSINLVASGIKGVVSDGAGLSIEKGVNPEGNIVLKKLGSSDDSVSISTSFDGGIDLKTAGPKGVESIGTGARLEDGLTGDRKLRLKTIKSSTLNIETSPDGTLTIDSVDKEFGYLKSFYVNSAYVPTPDSPSDGSSIRPFTHFDQARAAVIGNGTPWEPQNYGAKITLQTSSNSSQNPTINDTTIVLENDSILTYTGTDEYMFDTELIYPQIPKGSRGELTRSIRINIRGVGALTRNNGIGILRGMGSNRNGQGQFGDHASILQVGAGKDSIRIVENTNYPESVWEGDMTFANGRTYESAYGSPFKYTTKILPTKPLIYTNYQAKNPFNYGLILGGDIKIIPFANTAIEVGPDTYLNVYGSISWEIGANKVATKSAVRDPEFPEAYLPHDNRNFIETSGLIVAEKIIIDAYAGFMHSGVDNFIKLKNNASFSGVAFECIAPFYVNNFINISDPSNTYSNLNINETVGTTVIEMRKARNFLSTNRSTFSFIAKNSNITGFKNKTKESNVQLTIYTGGTLSSFFGEPVISGFKEYPNNQAAKDGKSPINAVFKNTTTNGLDTVK